MIALIAIYALWPADKKGATTKPATSSTSAAASDAPVVSAITTTAAKPGATAASTTDAGVTTLTSAKWGNRRGELGHERPAEGNAEGPMSFALAGKDLIVLDQVNGRVVRYDASGKPISSNEIAPTVQDVAVAANGNVMLLDRLGQKTITVTDPQGHHVGQLPLPEDPGTLTGVFVDGKDVYVEREHGALVRVGTTDGSPTSDGKSLQGRPSKDGELLLSAVMNNARVVLNAFDRKRDALRFTRAVEFPKPAHGIVMLDSDARGTIYLGVAGGEPEVANVACLDPAEGKVIGRITLPVSHVPEEAFRDFSVGMDGTIVYALRSDDGVEYRTARCP